MDFNIRCRKNKVHSKLNSFLGGLFKIYHLQSYYPIIDNYISLKKEEPELDIEFSNRFIIDNIEFKEEEECNYRIPKIYESSILDLQTNELYNKKVFFKINPLLHPLLIIKRKYQQQNDINLPFYKKYHLNRINKLSNIHNSAYVDTFCSYILSKLTENDICPNFPKYIGTKCGIMKEFWFNMEDEYEAYKDEKWFKEELKKENFNIFIGSNEIQDNNSSLSDKNMMDKDFIDSLYLHSKKSLNQSSECDTESYKGSLEKEHDSKDFNINILDTIEDETYLNNEEISEFYLNKLDNDFDLELSNNDLELSNNDSEENNNDSEENNNDSEENNNDSDKKEDLNPLEYEDSSSSSGSIKDFILDIEDELEDNLIDNISNISLTNVSNNSLSCDKGNVVYGILKDVPVNVIISESLEGTLENLLVEDKRKYMESDLFELKVNTVYLEILEKWKAYLWQIIFALAISQKYLHFTHNDLHSNNIMYDKTDKEFLYYKIDDKYYQVPTYGYIFKIIDFGRAIFKIHNQIYFSDVFEYEGEAGEQYTYPYEHSKHRVEPKVYPNKSFDLSRLASSIFDDLFPHQILSSFDNNELELYSLLLSWITDKNGELVTRFDDFNLYKAIARDVSSAIPKEQFNKKVFESFLVDEKDIKEKIYIYK